MNRIKPWSVLFLLVWATPMLAQPTDQAEPAQANPADVASADAIVLALYDVISGPADHKRDWDRFRGLFAPGAQLIPTWPKQDGSGTGMRIFTPDDYAQQADQWFARPGGFFEKEIARKTEMFGNIAQVFSTYASFRENQDDPFMRGINSIQLLKDNDRWWIVSVFWDSERPDNPIPEEYLPH